jgi:hypothetical protein
MGGRTRTLFPLSRAELSVTPLLLFGSLAAS